MRFEEDLLQFQQQYLAHKKHHNDKLRKLEYLVALISQGKIGEAIRKNENQFEEIPGSAFQHRGIFRDPTHAEQERRKMSKNKMYEEEVTECKCSKPLPRTKCGSYKAANEVQQPQISELEIKRSKVNLRPKLEDIYDADGRKINSANVLSNGCYMYEGQPLFSNYMLDCDKVMDDELGYEEPPIFDEEPPATLPPKIAQENCAEIPNMDEGAASFCYRSQQGGHELILWPKFVVEERESVTRNEEEGNRDFPLLNYDLPRDIEAEYEGCPIYDEDPTDVFLPKIAENFGGNTRDHANLKMASNLHDYGSPLPSKEVLQAQSENIKWRERPLPWRDKNDIQNQHSHIEKSVGATVYNHLNVPEKLKNTDTEFAKLRHQPEIVQQKGKVVKQHMKMEMNQYQWWLHLKGKKYKNSKHYSLSPHSAGVLGLVEDQKLVQDCVVREVISFLLVKIVNQPLIWSTSSHSYSTEVRVSGLDSFLKSRMKHTLLVADTKVLFMIQVFDPGGFQAIHEDMDVFQGGKCVRNSLYSYVLGGFTSWFSSIISKESILMSLGVLWSYDLLLQLLFLLGV